MKRQMAGIGAALVLSCAALGAAAVRDGAVIRNSGSTNFSGYTIKVWSDGSAWAVRSNRMGRQLASPFTAQIPVDLAQTFLHDAQQARKSGAQPAHCMKSASFGSASVVTYHGWNSPDLECPGQDAAVGALAADVHKIAALLNVQGGPRRIPMLPNEPRRVPSEGTGQPSATPEPSTSPS